MNIGFRVDSSYVLGTGHVHRCLNLAENFKNKKIKSFFFSKNYKGNINKIIKKKFKLCKIPFKNKKKNISSKEINIDANRTVHYVKKFKIDLIFIDNQQISKVWESIVGNYCKLVLITDDLNRKTRCDYLINYNSLFEDSKDYKNIINHKCKRLIGPDYSIIKKFKNKNLKNKNKISVFMGGVDSKNYTMKIIIILKKNIYKNYKKLIVIGEKNLNKKKLINAIKNYKNFKFVIGNKKNLFNYFKSSNLVISNCGTSMYEHMTMGLKSIIIPQSKIHKNICKKLFAAKLINFLNSDKQLNSKNINNILTKQSKIKNKEISKLYDGNGAKRIVEYFTDKINFGNIKIKEARAKDKYFLFKLFNDLTVIKNSLQQKKVTFKNHEKWFIKKINSKKSKIYIFKYKNLNLGQARLDKVKFNEVLITYSVSNEFRGKGVGYKIVKFLYDKVPKGTYISAKVKKNNLASKKIFNKLNFNLKNGNNKNNYLDYQLKK